MKKRGFILVNVIVIMTFLNMIMLTTFTMYKKSVNSSYEAIHSKSKQIYDKSFLYLLDEAVDNQIKYIIENKNPTQKVATSYFYDILRSMNNITFDKDNFDGVYVSFDNNLFVKSDHMRFSLRYGDTVVQYMIYPPTLNADDIKFINEHTGIEIYENYISAIKIERFVY